MERFEDPQDPLNGIKYHTGKPCWTKGCPNPAGTHWSPFLCQPCNVARMKRIESALNAELAYREGRSAP